MAQVAYKYLNPDISVIVKGAPNPTILRAIQQAAREFYTMSEAYIYTIPATTVAALSAVVPLTLPAQMELLRPLDMTYNNERLRTTSIEAANADYGRWDNPEQASVPGKILRASISALSLVPIPSATVTDGLRGTVALIPARLAAGIEQTFLDEHGDGIALGAISKLAGMKGTDWYAPDILGYYAGEFAHAIQRAKLVGKNEHTENGGAVCYGGI